MLQSVARQQRAQLRRLLAPALAAARPAQQQTAAAPAIAVAVAMPACSSAARMFSTAAAAAPAAPAAKKGGKKAEAAAAAAAAAAEEDKKGGGLEEEYNSLPSIPKPTSAELDALCLTEEQLRFSKRPMPDAATRRSMLPAVYMPAESPITSHTASDAGKYFHVREEIQRTIPTVLHRTMAQEYMGGGSYHMIRQPGLQIVQGLKQIFEGKQSAVARRVFGIRGASGTGKSASLHYAAQYVREHNLSNPDKPWLLIATRGQEFSTEKRGFIAPNPTKPGIYDQALYTMDWFAALAKSEESALSKISIKRKDKLADVQWPEGKVGTSLLDLALLASSDREQAPRLLYEFVAELRLPTEVPVLVIIDNVNVWDQVCEFVEPHTYMPLNPRKLALVDAFSYFENHAPVRQYKHAHTHPTLCAAALSLRLPACVCFNDESTSHRRFA
jgi:hypothetical protein